MANVRILIVVDGKFNLTTTYPATFTDATYGPDAWFTLSHLIATLRGAGFFVDTGSRGFNAAANFDDGTIVNTVPDPNATLKGPDPANPTPFRFDDPSVDLLSYDEIWLFGFEGFDGPNFPVGPGTGEPGGVTDGELAAFTKFMQAGGGVFATGDHDGLGSALCGRIPRVRYMRKWYSQSDNRLGIPPLAVTNWLGNSGAGGHATAGRHRFLGHAPQLLLRRSVRRYSAKAQGADPLASSGARSNRRSDSLSRSHARRRGDRPRGRRS